ncbi:DNA-3-methyladenine glycosylase [Leptolyngbya sp. FACHB-261]|uniref:DNA-3-methyladenine glycosylase family protein n=1 Tax=Leptolyngbya sp. FACHB-261 TaxID=2692806 RepID=UPI0016829CAE|nr:DNA-3-methyladenine glycosylase [Leptolyngbya sp. FACHB-261]MBD2102529.1 DNA-3-methyladenine glycosylase 2 family protein [Leptolyngbya sp. FACHB-261]
MATQGFVHLDYKTATDALKQADAVLATVIDQIGDCTLIQEQQTGDVFLSLCESIIYQQISGKAAASIYRRFLKLYPERSFPTAEAILNTDDDMLRKAGLSRAKVVYLKDLAQKVLEGLPTLDELKEMDDEAVVQHLTQVKGIGRWTAQRLLIFRLHRWDVLPADDLGVRAAVRRAYRLADLPEKKAVEQMGQTWKPYRTIAVWYLWRSLELLPS